MAASTRGFRRSLIWGLLGATLTCAAFAVPSPALAGKAPSLASTAQYKAFVGYVKKLDGLVGQPTSSAQKATYETELTTKKEAAAHKANALFKRSSEEAEAETDARAKEQAEAVRRVEEEQLEGVKAEYAAKLERAAASYHAKLGRVAGGRRNFEARVHDRSPACGRRRQRRRTPPRRPRSRNGSPR